MQNIIEVSDEMRICRHKLAEVLFLYTFVFTDMSREVKRTPRGWLQMINKRAIENKYSPKSGIGEKHLLWGLFGSAIWN